MIKEICSLSFFNLFFRYKSNHRYLTTIIKDISLKLKKEILSQFIRIIIIIKKNKKKSI